MFSPVRQVAALCSFTSNDDMFGRVRQMAALGAKLLSTIAGLFFE